MMTEEAASKLNHRPQQDSDHDETNSKLSITTQSLENLKITTSNNDGIKYLFKSGDKIYRLTSNQLAKAPHLETLYHHALDENFKEKLNDGVLTLDSTIYKPPLMTPIFYYLASGRAHTLFTYLPEGESPTELFKLLDFLCVSKPSVKIGEITKKLTTRAYKTTRLDSQEIRDLLSAMSELPPPIKQNTARLLWKTVDRKITTINPSLARVQRDNAVVLCWIAGDIIKTTEVNKVFNMVLYIVSHSRPFFLIIRTYKWFKESISPSLKQEALLLKWMKRFPKAVGWVEKENFTHIQVEVKEETKS